MKKKICKLHVIMIVVLVVFALFESSCANMIFNVKSNTDKRKLAQQQQEREQRGGFFIHTRDYTITTLNNKECSITHYLGLKNDLIIPDTIVL